MGYTRTKLVKVSGTGLRRDDLEGNRRCISYRAKETKKAELNELKGNRKEWCSKEIEKIVL